jgi:4-hydroxy-tetrahydrodipicolinate synthase
MDFRSKMFSGSIAALVTPMHDDGSIDFKSYLNLLEFHIKNSSDGVVLVGTTGEAPTIDFDEHIKLIEEGVKFINGRIPVIAGTGANSTKEAIYLTAMAKELGADACLLVTPYYNRPNQEGLYQHYKAINDAVSIPQILYNVPCRTGCDLLNDTVIKLSKLENIVGIKDATGDLNRFSSLKREVNKDFLLISGDDKTFLDFLELGGHGVISVTANVVPKMIHDICQKIFTGNIEEAKSMNDKLNELHNLMFVEPNPIPVKWALFHLNLIKSHIRLPLVELDSKYHQKIINCLSNVL